MTGPSQLALALAMSPRLVAALLREHVPDPAGGCRLCRRNRAGGGAGATWPCTTAAAARSAQQHLTALRAYAP